MTPKRPLVRRTAPVAVFVATALVAAAAGLTASPFTTTKVNAAPAKPSGLAAAFLAARHAEATADGQDAISFFDQALQYDPQNLNILSNTYFLAVQEGDLPAAIAAARKAYDIDARSGMAPVLLAIDHYKRGEYDRAWFYLGKVPAQGMNGFAMPLLRAWGLAPSQPVDKATAELAQIKNYNDTNDLVEVTSALLNEFYGNADAAAAHYDVLAKRIEEQRISIARLVMEGYVRLGKTQQAKDLLKRYEAAQGPEPALETMADPATTAVPRKVTPQIGMADALYAASELLLLNDANEYRAQVATAYAQSALYLNPDLGIARRFIASTLAARGHLDESNAMLASIKKGSADYLEAQMQIAENDAREKKLGDALTVLRSVAKDRPDWALVQIDIGDLLKADKKYPEAVTAYDTALKLTGDKADVERLYFSRGIALEQSKQWDAAEKDFRKALEMKPDDADVLNYLGYSYLDRGSNLAEARKLIEAAYKKRPDAGYIIDSYGWVLYVSGDYQKAVEQLEKAVESEPADATINEHLGDAYWKVGRHTEARFQWERALGLDVEEESQRTALRGKIEHGLAQK